VSYPVKLWTEPTSDVITLAFRSSSMTVPSSTVTLCCRRRISRGARRDVAGRQDAGGDLVEQRLEQVLPGGGDQGYVHVGMLQRRRTEKTAEARANDDDAMSTCRLRPV